MNDTLERDTRAASSVEEALWDERARVTFVPHLPLVFVTTLAGALVVSVVWSHVRHVYALIWLACVPLITVAYHLLYMSWLRAAPRGLAQRRWLDLNVLGAGMAAVVWGMTAIVLWPDGDTKKQGFIVLLLMAYASGATFISAPYPRLFTFHSVPVLALLLGRLLVEGSYAYCALLFLFALGMHAAVAVAAKSFTASTTLRLSNAQLVSDLYAAQKELVAFNQALEQRVDQRTFELKVALEHQRRIDADLSRFRALLDQAGAAILVVEERTLRVLDANVGAVEILGDGKGPLTGAELPTLDVAALFESEGACRRFLNELPVGQPRVFEDVRMTPDGFARTVEVSVCRRELAGEQLVLIVMRDVAERKALEAQLAQSGLLASLGTFAAGVSHEVNNPLAFMLSNLHFIQRALTQSPVLSQELRTELLTCTRESLEGGERVRTIVNELGNLARRSPDTRELVDVQGVLRSCLVVTVGSLRHRADVMEELADVPFVSGNRARLAQVVLNLLASAAQALPEGLPSEHEVRVGTRWRGPGQSVIIEVSHTGTPQGGVGFEVCRALVLGMGGAIAAESRDGRCFVRVSLTPVESAVAVFPPVAKPVLSGPAPSDGG